MMGLARSFNFDKSAWGGRIAQAYYGVLVDVFYNPHVFNNPQELPYYGAFIFRP